MQMQNRVVETGVRASRRAASIWPWLALPVAAVALISFAAMSGCGDDADSWSACNSSLTGPMSLGQSALVEVSPDDCRMCFCESSGLPNCSPTECPSQGVDGSAVDPGGSATDAQPTATHTDAGGSGEESSGGESDQQSTPSDGVPSDGISSPDATPGQPGPGPIEMPDCGCPVGNSVSVDAALDAIGLCDDSVVSHDKTGDDRQFAVMNDYFGVSPQNGNCLLVMSNGIAHTEPADGGLFDDGGVGAGHDFEMTATDPRPGESGTVYDLAKLDLDLTPPPEARGFQFDFMFLSAEWPQYLCQQYNDAFLTVVENDAIENGAPTNISRDDFDNEISVNNAFLELPADWTVDLSTTPFGVEVSGFGGGGFGDFLPSPDSCPSSIFTGGSCELPDYCDGNEDLGYTGSGSGWLRTSGPVDPDQESLRLFFSIHDEGDGVLDSKVLITNFEWLPYDPGVVTEKQ